MQVPERVTPHAVTIALGQPSSAPGLVDAFASGQLLLSTTLTDGLVRVEMLERLTQWNNEPPAIPPSPLMPPPSPLLPPTPALPAAAAPIGTGTGAGTGGGGGMSIVSSA